jgi:hypothetical protein
LAPGIAQRRAILEETGRDRPAPAKEGSAPRDRSAAARDELRRAYRVLGLVNERAGRFAAGLEAFDQGLALGSVPKVSTKQNSKVASSEEVNRGIYTNLLIGRAICLDALGRGAAADEAWKACRTATGANWDPLRVMQLAKNGQPEHAVRLMEESLRQQADGAKHYRAARVYATASASNALDFERKKQFADRAVAQLGEAKALGFFDDPKQRKSMETDGDLEPIRGRQDFKKFLADLQESKSKE